MNGQLTAVNGFFDPSQKYTQFTFTESTPQHQAPSLLINTQNTIIVHLKRDNSVHKYRIVEVSVHIKKQTITLLLQTTPFKFLIQEYCTKQNLDPESIVLKFNGNILRPEKSAQEQHISNDSVLEVSSFINPNANSECIFLRVRYKSDKPIKFKLKKVNVTHYLNLLNDVLMFHRVKH